MEAAVKESELYRERNDGVKFPRIIRVRKIAKMGSVMYVFYMAENQAAQAAHPNGGFIPLESFLDLWVSYDPKDPKYSAGNGQA